MTAATVGFGLQQYALLMIFGGAVLGLGWPLAGWMVAYPQVPGLYRWSLQLATGTGLAMPLLFVAGVSGQFNVAVVIALLLAGWSLALVAGLKSWSAGRTPAAFGVLLARCRAAPGTVRWWGVALLLLCLPLLVKPLQTPAEWDELMYHLPYARFWAEQGSLAVNEWLRYPLSAYNMNLLYGAALLAGSDVLAHLIHASFGLLTAALTFAVGRCFLDAKVGLVAALLVLYTGRWAYDNATVDLGLMLFWSAAFASLALRHRYRDARFAWLAAFLAGIAVGIKYQGLFFLPVFVVLALVLERRARVVAGAVLVFALVGGYWYLRNYLLSGDPVHPVGGPLFGFWLWDARDLANQFDDLDRARVWRHWVYLPALLAAAYWRRSSPFLRGLLLCAAGFLLIWYPGSGYWRYAVSVYPMLALLTAYVLVQLWPTSALMALRARLPGRRLIVCSRVALLVLALAAAWQVLEELDRVHPDDGGRRQYLAGRFAGYALVSSLPDVPGRMLYQLGFEDQIYYLPRVTIGDWFGPARYADVMRRGGDAAALSKHLAQLGADTLLVNLDRAPFSGLVWDPRMTDYFKLLARSDSAALYLRLTDWESATVPATEPNRR